MTNFKMFLVERMMDEETNVGEADHGIMNTIRNIIVNGPAKVKGMLVDVATAKAISQLFDALTVARQERYVGLTIQKMADMAWKIMRR